MVKESATTAAGRTTTAAVIANGVGRRDVARRRLSDQVAEELENLVVSGQLRAGDTLPSERDLMALFGVGRTSIREALFSLQRKGIVGAQAGLRPVVTQPRADTIVAELSGTVRLFLASEPGTREFQAARRFFEPAVARYAAVHASAADIASMEAALANCDQCVDDPARFVEADVAFHFAIVEATHNQLLIGLHRAVVEWLREQRTSSVEPAGSSRAAHRAHRRVLQAIRDRDPDRAEKAMVDHLHEVEHYYWKARARGANASRGERAPKSVRSRRRSQ
jgi:DNA-binding FadR family transcriptional regulator